MHTKPGEWAFAIGGIALFLFYVVLFIVGCDGKPASKVTDDNCLQHECCSEMKGSK